MRRMFAQLPTRLIALCLAILWGVVPAGAAPTCACGAGCTAQASADEAANKPACCSIAKAQTSCCAQHAAQASVSCCCENPDLARTSCTDCGCVSVPTSSAPARIAPPDAPEAAAPIAPVAAWLATIPPTFDLQAANAAAFFHPQPPVRILFSVWRN